MVRFWFFGMIAVLLVGGCASAPAAGASPAEPSASAAPQGPSTTRGPITSPPSPSLLPELAAVLPVAFGDVEAHTFPVAQDLVGRLAALLGVPLGDLDVAYASEHGARFIQMLAVRGPNVPEGRMLDVLADAAYPPIAVDALEVGTDTLDGVEVVTVHNPELAPRLGTYYGLVRGGALIVVEAFEREAAESAIGALP